ncbi:MAG TPA: DUF4142 domain-containing protein [Tepidisphaeraceae bacterium]|jgi:putative membrane protein
MSTRLFGRRLAGVSLCVLVAGCATPSIKDRTSPLTAAEQKFMMSAAENSNAEVVAGKMAVKKATNPQVKAFAQRMVDEHMHMNHDMLKLADDKDITIPKTPDEQHNEEAAMMAQMSGAEFDTAYMNAQVADHSKTVAMFEQNARTAVDPDLQAFIAKHGPMMRDHLQAAQALSQTISTAATPALRPGTVQP